jgi:uncharacterized protein YecE (DUF72 family)
MILVGTSGFQYRDWTTVFYPQHLDPQAWLNYYSRQFSCCEIGYTCYRIPEVQTIHEIIEETRGNLPLVFRAPSRFSEDHPDNGDLARRFVAALWPLKEIGQLAGVLARFPPEFAFIQDNFKRLRWLQEVLEGLPLIAEFGCPDWHSLRATKHLAAARIAFACVDGGKSLKEKTFFARRRRQPMFVFKDGINPGGSRATDPKSTTTCTAEPNWRQRFLSCGVWSRKVKGCWCS